ncbi:hypothetical protein [Novosphingobium soli]|uniref:Uncharacterized protein n=1 Tax=Novosphingobium soli TaxID=574956 RepID=A0ABV6CWH7_9SPHN
MKTFAVSMALGAVLLSTAAQAADQRPAYIAFKAGATKTAAPAAPATPVVAKRKSLQSEVVVPAVLGVAAVGTGLALALDGGNDDDDASPE